MMIALKSAIWNQPLSVIEAPLESFGPDQRVDEVGRDHEAHDAAQDKIDQHGRLTSGRRQGCRKWPPGRSRGPRIRAPCRAWKAPFILSDTAPPRIAHRVQKIAGSPYKFESSRPASEI